MKEIITKILSTLVFGTTQPSRAGLTRTNSGAGLVLLLVLVDIAYYRQERQWRDSASVREYRGEIERG